MTVVVAVVADVIKCTIVVAVVAAFFCNHQHLLKLANAVVAVVAAFFCNHQRRKWIFEVWLQWLQLFFATTNISKTVAGGNFFSI